MEVTSVALHLIVEMGIRLFSLPESIKDFAEVSVSTLIRNSADSLTASVVGYHLDIGTIDCINDFLQIYLSSVQWHILYTDSLVVHDVKCMEYNLTYFFLTSYCFIPLAVQGTGNIFERSIGDKHLSVNDSPCEFGNLQITDMRNRIGVLTEPSSLLTDSSTKASSKLLVEVQCGSCAIELFFDIIVGTIQTGILLFFLLKLFGKHRGDRLDPCIFIVFSTSIALRK